MADGNLPLLNAFKEQSAQATDDRQRLQKSLRAGLLNVVKSVDRLNDSVTAGLKLQQSQLRQAEAAADRAEFAALENEREAARAGDAEGGGDVTVNGDVTVDTEKSGGLLSGLGSSIGGFLKGAAAGVGIGAGAFLAGAGILAGGAGFLLKELNNLDGENIKKQVVTLLSIGDEFEGGNWEFLKSGGAFFAAMTGIGLGLAVFSVGSGIAGMSDALLDKFNSDWTTGVKDNVVTLLSIKDSLGGNIGMLADGGAFFLAMSGIGIGLGVFGVGSAIAGLADGLTKFGNSDWAQSIKDNVVTLLSIKDELGGNVEMLKDGFAFPLAMLGVATGLAVFGIGSAVSGITSSLVQFMDPSWAQNIKTNVVTLLSIKDELGGNVDMLMDSGTFFAAMYGIGVGLAVFGLGAGIAGLAAGMDMFRDGSFGVAIKDNVTTLMSISDSLGGAQNFIGESATFLLAMTGIGAGLAVFGLGAGVAGFVRMFTGSDLAQGIKDDVDVLMTVADTADVQKTETLKTAMSNISDALTSFASGSFVGALANVGSSILNFLSGEESPIEQMLGLADRSGELDLAAFALESLAESLEKVGNLKFDGSELNFKAFAQDLYDSVPLIEAAIGGGKVDGGWFGADQVFKGLASPDIPFAIATKRVQELQKALGGVAVGGSPSGGMAGAVIEADSVSVMGANAGGGTVVAPTTVTNNQSSTQTTVVSTPARVVPLSRRSKKYQEIANNF